MQTFKANSADLANLKQAAESLKQANAQLASAKKQADAAKEYLAKWLLDNRGVNLEACEIGEIVTIADVVMVERAKQNKFDEKAFSLANPALYLANKRDFPMTKFKPLV